MSTDLERRGGAGELAHRALDSLLDNLERPEFRAGLAVSAVTAAVLARTGLRATPTLALALAAGASAEHCYGMLIDIHATFTAAPDDAAVS